MSRLTDLLRQARKVDLTKPNVRQAVREAASAKGLYQSDLASDY